MMALRTILVPVALSPACAWAARYSNRLARSLEAALIFLHVTGRPGHDLKDFLAAEIPGASYRTVVLKGDPAERIVEFARKECCDLILMPTHAHGRFRRFLLGSVTAKVLHDAACPVWTGVHHEDAPLADEAIIRSIVCAVDTDASCTGTIRQAQELAARFQARVKVIHAVAAADPTSDNVGEMELRRYLFGRAQARFSALLDAAGLSAEVTLGGGPVAQVVRETALHEHADLVVIGRGHTQCGLGRLRTNAYSIIRESPCPVLSI